jgi:hypothetical protein
MTMPQWRIPSPWRAELCDARREGLPSGCSQSSPLHPVALHRGAMPVPHLMTHPSRLRSGKLALRVLDAESGEPSGLGYPLE